MIDRSEKHGSYQMPLSILPALRAYKFDGTPTGDFLRKVIENDLVGTIGAADVHSMEHIRDICRWVYWELPIPARGPEGYKKWIAIGGLEGIAAAEREAGRVNFRNAMSKGEA